jgi:hypothetical protein
MGMNKTELRDAVEVTRKEYFKLTEQHERLLACAERAPEGSCVLLQALHCANDLGPHVALALRQYLDAVEILTVFYQHVRRTKDGDTQLPQSSILHALGLRLR